MDTIRIRSVTIEDLDPVAAIEAAGFPPQEAAGKESLRARMQRFADCFLLAEENGRPVGYIGGCMCATREILDLYYEDPDSHDPDAPYQSVFSLVVLPEYQHRGIAVALMNAFIELSRRRGKEGLVLTCKEKLIPFYRQFGYVCGGVSGSAHGGAVWYDMFLPLA